MPKKKRKIDSSAKRKSKASAINLQETEDEEEKPKNGVKKNGKMGDISLFGVQQKSMNDAAT